MKTISIALLALLVLGSCKTSNVPHRESVAYEVHYASFAQPTPKRDTLYLLANDPVTVTIRQIWDTVKVKPAIILVTNEEMLCIKKRCNEKVEKN